MSGVLCAGRRGIIIGPIPNGNVVVAAVDRIVFYFFASSGEGRRDALAEVGDDGLWEKAQSILPKKINRIN